MKLPFERKYLDHYGRGRGRIQQDLPLNPHHITVRRASGVRKATDAFNPNRSVSRQRVSGQSVRTFPSPSSSKLKSIIIGIRTFAISFSCPPRRPHLQPIPRFKSSNAILSKSCGNQLTSCSNSHRHRAAKSTLPNLAR